MVLLYAKPHGCSWCSASQTVPFAGGSDGQPIRKGALSETHPIKLSQFQSAVVLLQVQMSVFPQMPPGIVLLYLKAQGCSWCSASQTVTLLTTGDSAGQPMMNGGLADTHPIELSQFQSPVVLLQLHISAV
jgi:hypothetical protein